MGVLVSSSSGDFTSSAPWSPVVCFYDGTAAQATTTTYAYGTFAGTASVVDAMMVRCGGVADVPVGNVYIQLYNQTDAVVMDEIIVPTVKLPHSGAGLGLYNHGWFVFKFSGAQTLFTGKDYRIGLRSNPATMFYAYRGGLPATGRPNWGHGLRTVGTYAAPAAGDQLIIAGEYENGTAAYNIVMDNVSTTSFGTYAPGTGGQAVGIYVCSRGSLTWATGSSTYLRHRGRLDVTDSGTVSIGTADTPIPAGYTATVEFDGSVLGDSGFYGDIGGVSRFYGTQMGAPWTLMTESVGGYYQRVATLLRAMPDSQSFIGLTGSVVLEGVPYTISSVNTATEMVLTSGAAGTSTGRWVHPATSNVVKVESTAGWSEGDTLIFTPAHWDRTDFETTTILSVDSGTQVTLSSELTKPHLGIPPVVQCEVANISRNVRFVTRYPPLYGFYYPRDCHLATVVGVEFNQCGSSLNFQIDTQVFTMRHSALYLSGDDGISVTGNGVYALNLTDNIVFGYDPPAFISAISSYPCTISGNLFMQTLGSGSAVVVLGSVSGVFQNNHVCGYAQVAGIYVNAASSLGVFSDNVVHSTQRYTGLEIVNLGIDSVTIDNLHCWMMGGGLTIRSQFASSVVINNYRSYACNTGINLAYSNTLTFNGWINAGLFYQSSYAIASESVSATSDAGYFYFNDCDFSKTGANYVDIASASIRPQINTDNKFYLANCHWVYPYMNAANGLGDNNLLLIGESTSISVQRANGTVGDNVTYVHNGTIIADKSIFDITPSLRLCPEIGYILKSTPIHVVVPYGSYGTVTIKTRESVASDGAAYNGNRPAIYVQENGAAGILSDTLLATATAAGSGGFETLTAVVGPVQDNAVLNVYVTAGGTDYSTGWVNVDTVVDAANIQTGDYVYWKEGQPFAANAGGGEAGGGGPTSITYAY